jgi:peptidoglycan/LPS O-acetylase OafA/YrhL
MVVPSGIDKSENGGAFPPRLVAVEGVRAYLALWVVVCHAMWASGYEPAMLSGLPSLLRQGDLAVEVFVIISAFVIFLLLDTKRLSFGQFIVRRFFRLFPLFIALFIIAIPLSRVSLWNATHAAAYLAPQHIDHLVLLIDSWWQNLHWHLPLHLLMLQGAVPERLLQDAPGAFLDPRGACLSSGSSTWWRPWSSALPSVRDRIAGSVSSWAAR